MKKSGKYIIITLLLLLGLCCVGLLFLFFVPNSTIFGVTFISYNERVLSEFYKAENVSRIVLESRSYDINVKSTNKSEVSIVVETHSLGYVLKKNSNVSIKEDLTQGILTFEIIEPYGAAFKNGSKITLYVPEKSKSNLMNLSIENKNANLTIEDENVCLNNLIYKSQSGSARIKNATIMGTLNLDLNKSTFNLDSSAVLDANNINLKLTSGKFNASETTLGNVEISSNAQGVIILGTCSLLKSPDEEKITGGRIEAEQIEKLYFTGSDTDIYIKETTTIVDITLTNSGCVEIKKISGTADIVTSKGDIDINSCTPDLLSLWATTTKGDIKIKNAYNKIFTETTSGNVLTEFANDTAPVSLSNTYTSYFNGKTKTGKIVVTGLTRADVEIEDGSADLTFSNFNKNLSIVNTINSKNGNVYIKVDSASAFVLNSFTKGNSRINLLQTEVYKGWTEKTVNENINYAKNETVDELTANYVNITVSESGNVLMHDNKVN